MSLHNFNPNNKSWKMYSNTITSISGDNLTIKPYDGKNLLLEVSGNNNIFFKKGDISYGLEDLIDTNITLTSVSGDIIPSNDNTFKLGDVSKNWSNAYIHDLSVSNISVSENFILNISGSMTDITDTFNNLGNTFYTIETSIYNIEQNVIDLSNNKAPLANPSFTGTVVLPYTTSIGLVTSDQLAYVSGATSNIQTQLNDLSNNKANSASPSFSGTITISGDISNIRQIIPGVISDISTSLGTSTNIWQRAFIRDLSGITSINGTSWPLTSGTSDFSASNISTSLIPTNTNSIDLGSSSKYLKNAYVRDISLTNMTASGSVVPIVPELDRPALPVGGTVIALNSTGTIVATNIQYISGTGRVRVYEFTNNTWIQVGQDVSMGTNEFTNFGCSIGLNGDGTILAVGAPDKSDSVNALDSAGCVTVYKYTTSWDILGQFYGESAYALFGSNISLNDSGTVIAIGSRGDQSPNYPYGVVKVYNYINNDWTNIGSINGLIWVGRNGEGLSLNGDGTILAISTSNINQWVWNSPKNGFVNVYRYISGTTWQPYGQQINGTQADEMFGYSISLNYNGNIVAIGSPLYDDVSSVSINTGRVLVYKYSDITWELLGNIFNGYAAGDFFGRSVSLNAAGNVLAIGVPYYDVGTTTVSNHSHGRVLLYNYNNGWGKPIIINGSPAQRGAGWFVALNRSGTVVGYCQVFDNNGIDAPTDYPVTFYINQIANNEGGSIGKNETRWSTSYITNMYSDTIRPMNNGSGSLGASDSVFDIAYLNTLSASKIIASTIRTSNIIATNRVYEINTTSMSWESHNANAMSQGKTLASILNATENQQVVALLLSNNISRAFIGGIRTYNSNTTGQTLSDWRWINGDNWSYTNFMPNQPDQQQERFLEYYTASLGSITHQWNDIYSDGGYGFSSAAVYMSNVDINLLTSKANSANPTFTGTVVLPANTINSSHIADGTILGTDISAGTITEDKLSSAVQTKLNLAGTIPANSINSSHIIDGSILGTDISAGTINLSNLSASAISSLTTLTIPANSINSSHIQNGTITGADIGAYTITDGNILFNSIGNDKLNDLTIQDNKIANTTISLGKLTADAITSLQTTPANSINSSHIIDGSILTADISNNAITNAKIADFSITNSKLDDNSIDSRKIIAGSILGTDIAINQIGINHLTGLAYLDLVTAQAPDSINSSHIINGSITGSDIAGTTITGANIADATITYDKLNADVTSLITNSIPAGISADSALSIENRLKALEDNALISSTDTIISGTTGNQIVIPIDLVNNESVTINFTFQLPGAYNGNEVYISYRTNGVGYNFEEARATTIVHNGNTYVKTGGAITQSIEAQNLSNVFTIKVYRSFTTNTPSQRYLMEGEGAYCVAGQGNARVEFNGMISGRIPNEIFITHGNLYSMSARYSVINNKDSTVISSVSSLASVGSITRKFISSSTNASTIQIPLDFTTYKSVEVEITFTFFGTIWGGSRLRAMYKSSDNVVRDFNYYNLTTLSGRINDPWYREDWGTDSYRGMCMFDMATNLDGDGYWSSGNLKMRIHRGNNPRPDSWSKIYFVSGETNYARAGWGPTQGIINANTIYLPTALLFDTNSTAGTTFNAEWYITGYT